MGCQSGTIKLQLKIITLATHVRLNIFRLKSQIMEKKKGFWTQPWSYKQSFLIAFLIVISGFLMEIITTGYAIKMPVWPYNLLIIILFIAYILVVYFFFKSRITKWLSSTAAAISSIAALTILILLMGFIPTGTQSRFFRSYRINRCY